MKKLGDLEKRYEDNLTEKDKLENEIKLCASRLERAHDLTEGLTSENERWRETVGVMEQSSQFIEGNTLLACIFVNYLGPFTFTFREQALEGLIR